MYDALAVLYSFGAIGRAKRAHLQWVTPGQRILYAGAGTGDEGVQAAARGALVTLVDSSARMVRLARRRAGHHSAVRVVHANVFELRERYDHVVAPFFLNVLGAEDVPDALQHLCRLVRPGGLLTIADFRGPAEAPWLRPLQWLHHLLPLALFRVLTGNPWHSLYDYPTLLANTIESATRIAQSRSRVLGMPLYESTTWRLP